MIKQDSNKQNNIKLVPFRKMGNVSTEFCLEEYEIALTHPDCVFLGLVAMIHLNDQHPQYINLKIDKTTESVSIYTKNGWRECEIADIFEQLKRETTECLQYVKNNGKTILEQLESRNRNK